MFSTTPDGTRPCIDCGRLPCTCHRTTCPDCDCDPCICDDEPDESGEWENHCEDCGQHLDDCDCDDDEEGDEDDFEEGSL